MKITKLLQNKRENLVDIYVDDEFFKSVDKNFVINYGLEKGKELDKDQIMELENKSIINKLYNFGVNRVLSRPRSINEMKQYLSRKEREYSLVELAVSRLEGDNYLNDKEFSIWWVDNRNTFRNKSRLELQMELQKKGISKDIIHEVLDQYMSDEQEERNIRNLAEKKLKELNFKDIPEKEKREKLLQFLQRKGYNWELILKIQKELI